MSPATDDQPRCCGQPMQADEYDADADEYLFVCAVNPHACPVQWWQADDEVWK